MSFEGYYQIKCENNHYYTQDVYSFCSSSRCSYCDGKIVDKNMVDETNYTSDGYDSSFAEGCDSLVTVWKSELEMLKQEKEKYQKIAMCQYMHKIYVDGSGSCLKCGWLQNKKGS